MAWRAPIAEKIAEILEEKWVDYIARQKPGCVSTVPSDLINSTVSPLTRRPTRFLDAPQNPIASRCDDAPNSTRDIPEEKEKKGKNIVNVIEK